MTIIQQFPEVWQTQWQTSGFSEPSFIQLASFEPLKEKQNVLGISPTGSGKTLAYLLPLLLNVEPKAGSQLLILAPSQELAMQIAEVARTWGQLLALKTQALIGGANISRQIERLKKHPEVLIGTPGRVLELIKSRKIKIQKIQTIVMDEVDQLFQAIEGNLTQQILHHAIADHQLVFFSATADRIVEEAKQLAQELTVIDARAKDLSAGSVTHYFLRLAPRKKADYLRSLAYTPSFRGVIFFNQVQELGAIEEKLLFEQVPAIGLASDQSKHLRKLAIEQFKKKQVHLLLTTDVAARGLDFADIPFVVNVDVPLTSESYLHRAGRVGRMGAEGAVITFVNDATQRDYQRLMKQMQQPYQEIYLYEGALHLKRKGTAVKPQPLSKQAPSSAEERTKKSRKKHTLATKNREKKRKNKGARRK